CSRCRPAPASKCRRPASNSSEETHPMPILRRTFALALVLTPFLSHAQAAPSAEKNAAKDTGNKAWIARSDENAQILLKTAAKYQPEGAGRQGVSGLDEQISQFPSDRRTKLKADTRQAISELQSRLAAEKDPLVKQDLEILITAAQRNLHGLELNEKYEMPYFNVTQLVFNGIRALLDDQVPPERRKAALVRLRKYTGMEPGYQPITEQAKARTAEWTKPGQLGAAKVLVETDVARADFFINGIGQLFEKYKI